MRKAIFPGSFSPLHIGHIDIIKRASKLFDELIVLVSVNFDKEPCNIDEVFKNVEKDVAKLNLPNVIVMSNKGLTAEFARENNVNYIVRSLRNEKDAEYEIKSAQVNYSINNNLESVILVTKEKLQHISSSLIKQEISKIKK